MKNTASSKAILVPVDFTEIIPNTLNHAAEMARLFGKPIALLHVVNKGLFDSNHKIELEEEEALAKLQNMAEQFFAKTGITTTATVRRGSIYDVIGELAQELPAALVVMGTHGVKGIQKIIGSNAIRVIVRSGEIPFLVVQQRPIPHNGYRKVVLPLGFTKESRQKLNWATELHKRLNCTFYILAETESDEFLARGVEANLAFAQKYLSEHNCRFEVTHAPAKTDFYKDIINHAIQIEADMIMLMTEEETKFSEYFTAPDEQNVIANPAQIPVFCINPVDNMQISSAAMFQ